MKTDFIVTAFYTKNTGYETEIKKLLASLSALGVDYHFEGIKSLGSWDLNTKYKVGLIRRTLDLYDRNVLYLDADAVMHKYPALLDVISEDIAVHYRNDKELLSGTLYFRNTAVARSILDGWKQLCVENPTVWDQRLLQKALQAMHSSVNVYKLPPTYCKIFDTMKDVTDPVIEHFQASRRFKRSINESSIS